MSEEFFQKIRLYFTALVTIAIGSLLLWDHFHGGVPSHHLLADKNLPSISNCWGALLLPVLTWFLTYRIQQRIFHKQVNKTDPSSQVKHAVYGFIGALLFGILATVFYELGYPDATGNLLLTLFPLALFLPIYRAEYLLGFVIGMTYTFGPVLPVGIGSILALICALLFLYVRAGIVYVFSKIRGK